MKKNSVLSHLMVGLLTIIVLFCSLIAAFVFFHNQMMLASNWLHQIFIAASVTSTDTLDIIDFMWVLIKVVGVWLFIKMFEWGITLFTH
jgi:hypothetical protein